MHGRAGKGGDLLPYSLTPTPTVLSHGRAGKGGEGSGNLADPAVLHADLRLLLDIVLLLSAATIGGMLAAVVGMPPIVGYIAGGVLVGPMGWGLVKSVVQVETLAQFGSIFFLFEHGVCPP